MMIKAQQDLLAGLLFAAIGMAGIWLGTGYDMGTALSMGPGYFPVLVFGALALVGLVIAGKAFLTEGPPLSGMPLRPLLAILGALLLFWALAERAGFIAASLAMVAVSFFAEDNAGLLRRLAFGVALVLVSAFVFVRLLGLPFKLWP